MPSPSLSKTRSAPLVGTLAVVLAGALWAIAAAVARDLFDAGVDPLDLAAARSMIAALGLSLVADAWRPPEGGRPALVVALGIAIALVNATYYIAIEHLAVAVAIVLQYTGPAMLVGWLAVRSKTLPSRSILVALGGALAGVVLASEAVGSDVDSLDLVGLGAGLASGAFFATYTLLSERTGEHYGSVGALRRAFTAASTFWLVFLISRGWPAELFEGANPWRALFVGVMGTLAPFWLYLWGVSLIRAERASIVATSEPVLAALVAWVWLGQDLGPLQIVGGLLVVAAIVSLQLNSPETAPADRV